MIERKLFQKIKGKLFKGKAIIVTGPRQVGKTTLLHWLHDNTKHKVLSLDGDEPDTRKMLSDVTSTQLKRLIGNNTILMIDEAQRIKNIGVTLKLITDKIKNVQLIATGSSSFELSNEINEPLTGRKIEYNMYPVSVEEMINAHGATDEKRLLETRLIYGMYPDVINNAGNEMEVLKNLTTNYLFKDIFLYKDVRKPEIVHKLLEALALQAGSEVSYNELGQVVGADRQTIENYITLLEQTFVIFRLRSFSRNHRNELKKSRKIYFYDNGIRNALIANFNPVGLRQDKGALLENFLVSERMKFIHYNDVFCNSYFWRTKQQQEIDYLEDKGGRLYAFEIKWSSKKKSALSKTFSTAYPKSLFANINADNYFDFVTRE